MKNQQAMMRKLKALQDEMIATQNEINATLFTGTAGGVVTVKVYGTKHVSKIEIDRIFEIKDTGDMEMLEDMIVAALKEAYEKIDRYTQEKMEKYQMFLGGMGGF